MKILVLGGTRFIGRHLVAECLARGDDLTVLYRGHSPSPFAGLARHILTDRRAPTAEARAVLSEPWDVVIDTSAVDLDDVTPLTPLLTDVGRYVFVSSCAVYRRQFTTSTLREQSPTIVADTTDPTRASATRKLRCERHLRGRARRTGIPLLVARLGLVVGKHDYSHRFTYWLEHVLRGGEALVPMDPDQPVQIIDASDVAKFLRDAVDRDVEGIVNVAGRSITAQNLIEALLDRSPQPPVPCWVGERYARSQRVRPWTEVPLWLTNDSPERALMAVDSSRALAAGLTYRSLRDTIDDCLAWHTVRRSWSQRWLDPAREQHLIQQWRA
ncbi:NAD-dependent epimerase/dehydratase family protein [Dactylosporangium sp. NPDC050688]|uniref:NAD-dependent epimerase/dehydratase family protein n=1 Tax=Dactylosporangium sp. NPDC050688 TaxID=3157217 RepID=UPI0033F55CAF